MREFHITANDAGQRLDKFVQKAAKNMPLSLVYKFIRTKKIKVNRKRAENNQLLNTGDIVLMFVPEDVFAEKTTAAELLSAPDMPDVIYEDENIILCDKPSGMLSHSGELDGSGASERGTLIYAVRSYLCKKGEYDPSAENSFAPSLANRIDRNTSGIVIAAKNAPALRELNDEIRERRIEKYYLCAVHGRMERASDTLTAYHQKNAADNTVKITSRPLPESKTIVTAYKTVDYNAQRDLSLLEVRLETGRTHQIRAHMEFIGHPLLGENKYGATRDDFTAGFNTQALCSYRVKFTASDGFLAYLADKSFTVPAAKIPFIDIFSHSKTAPLFN